MARISGIEEHMEVVGADGGPAEQETGRQERSGGVYGHVEGGAVASRHEALVQLVGDRVGDGDHRRRAEGPPWRRDRPQRPPP